MTHSTFRQVNALCGWAGFAAVFAVLSQSVATGEVDPPRAFALGVTEIVDVVKLSPGNLAIASVSGEVAGELFTGTSLVISASAVTQAREEHWLESVAHAHLLAAIRAGGLTLERAVALDAAQACVDAAILALEVAEGDFREIAVAALIDRVGPENAALAQRAASNLSRRVPDAWKVLDLSPDSPVWRTLESAWFKAQRGLPDSAFTQAEREALAAAQSDPTVALAQQRLDANLAGVEAAWAQFIAEQMAEPQPPM